jgi:hypothetical protein
LRGGLAERWGQKQEVRRGVIVEGGEVFAGVALVVDFYWGEVVLCKRGESATIETCGVLWESL